MALYFAPVWIAVLIELIKILSCSDTVCHSLCYYSVELNASLETLEVVIFIVYIRRSKIDACVYSSIIFSMLGYSFRRNASIP